MENPSEPERSSPDNIQPTYVRPPGLEFALGVALFALILMTFSVIQVVVFILGVIERSPGFDLGSLSLGLLQDPRFQERMDLFRFHGDVIASTAFWSGFIGLFLIVVTVTLWKRRNTAIFLGLHLPRPVQFAKWTGIFLLLGIAVELITRFVPGFESDFMVEVLRTASDKWLLFIAVALVAPLFEEFLLRGLLFGSIRHLASEHTAVAITAGVFTLMHMQYDWAILLLILPMGIVLGYARSRSGSIWVPVVLHILNNSASVLFSPA
jgi:uncharacterized protein